ncbi:chitin disaccharide deacetylase [Cytobacillus sp. FJAT-54145]|uniref:Carbohydrate deacetylase n=1 Tax=Cytobacillus spartinae TaxID=3299023 RepID=A0ABW6K7Q8_9BACI
MTKLIINADDFGYSKGVNLGIIEAYKNGVVTSATMMTNMPGAAHAAALALENPDLGVGVHLVLDCGRPVSDSVPSLINENGDFHKIDGLEKYAELSDIEKEYTCQIEKFLSLGLVPTHLDSHHHLHGHKKIYPIVEKLAQKYNLPVRKVSAEQGHSSNSNLKMVNYFNHEFFGDDLTTELFIEIINKTLSYEISEVMTHPAFIDESILRGSSYALQRVRELTILTSEEVKEAIVNKKIDLATYKEVSHQSLV